MISRLGLVCCLLLTAAVTAAPARAQPAAPVLVVPIHGTLDQATARFAGRELQLARARRATVVLDIDTAAGLPAAALRIRDEVAASGLPVDAYVRRASSAGALVALSAGRLVMAPGALLGDAAPFAAGPAGIAAQRGEFERTAARAGHSTRLAGAMVDGSVDVAAYKAPGATLALTATQAREGGLSEATVPTLAAAVDRFGPPGAPRERASYSPLERAARLATSPGVSGVLLAVAFLALLIELQTLHLVAGTLAAGALAVFYGTHLYAGFADGAAVLLGLAGIVLILTELHVLPGHGLAGMLGVAALVGSVLLAFGLPFIVIALQALAVAIVLSAAAFALLQRVLPENAFVKRLMFAGAQGADYVASTDYRALLGSSGVAISFLRPAGLAAFGERRVDVLSEGDFVPAGTLVRVTRVEGARIFVKPEES